ncbi:hypothetical protein OH146_11085 [Salinibacterium sp. SYSU T00001]|uniref:hypothetical protein n=1 Tax=Homoserinimonas sedimenticola TaxID=2986805 RepID=UPI002235B9C1|nr:hypothetical protein [Salinibacterium sedimenticola]MCW4386316.1 hypothetical protein [Salinibacterium sedimenticola]
MIIEAGYDLLQLFAPKLFRRGRDRRRMGMWVITMDKNLRQLDMRKVSTRHMQSVEECIPRIADMLSNSELGEVAYYAFARLDTDLPVDLSCVLEHQHESLALAPELVEYKLLNNYLSNGRDLYSRGPRYSYRDYIGMEHLPRAAVLPGPHDYPCACLACTQHEELLRERRAAAANREPDGAG